MTGLRNVAECTVLDVHDVIDIRIVLDGDGTLGAEVAVKGATFNVIGSPEAVSLM